MMNIKTRERIKLSIMWTNGIPFPVEIVYFLHKTSYLRHFMKKREFVYFASRDTDGNIVLVFMVIWTFQNSRNHGGIYKASFFVIVLN